MVVQQPQSLYLLAGVVGRFGQSGTPECAAWRFCTTCELIRMSGHRPCSPRTARRG